MKIISHSHNDTENIGSWLAQYLRPGIVVILCGEFGAGKTVLVKGIARALKVKDVLHTVISPSFTLVKEYDGVYPVFHFDLYRIQSEDDLFSIGYDDYLSRGGLIIVEWADKFLDYFPENRIKINFRILSKNAREIIISGIDHFLRKDINENSGY